jgi:hypothetical protein
VNGIDEIIARVFNDPNKVKLMFHPKHNLDKLGSPNEAIEKITKAVLDQNQTGGTLPKSGPFTITRQIDGYIVEIRAAIINGELRYGTLFLLIERGEINDARK